MSKVYKVLGQAISVANTNTAVCTGAANKQTIASSITIFNRSKIAINNFDLALVPSGEVLSDKHYLFKEKLLDPRDSNNISVSYFLQPGDILYIHSNSNDLSITVCGLEIT